MDAFLLIFSKVLIILIMICVGYFITKKGMLSRKGSEEITNILVKMVVPCLIVKSFIDSQGSLGAKELLLAATMPFIGMGISIGISYLFFKKEPEERRTVLRFSLIFSNMGFMGLPLVQAIVGERGVIYASFGIVVFNIITWTYGYRMMNSEAKLNWRTIILNPGIISLLIGLPIFFLNIQVPSIIKEPLNAFASLNTPLAMLVIGSYIARVDAKSFVSDKSLYSLSFYRLILAPGLFFLVLMLIKPEPELFLAALIQAAAPVAANATLFAVQYKKDSALASEGIAVSTVLSIITIPLFTVLAQMFITAVY